MALLAWKKNQNGADQSGRGMSPEELNVFQSILYDQSGIVLKDNKRALVEARVTQRLRALGMSSYRVYLDYLGQDRTGAELVHLIDAISTNITHFFREPDHFEFVGAQVERWAQTGLKRLRFWSAACSTGEEPYSLAMTLHDPVRKHGLDVKILATDISTRVLARAQAGLYTETQMRGVSPELRRRHFTQRATDDGAAWEISGGLKDMVMFRRLNFTVFPYPIKGVFDIIFCRNAMIYFDRELRSRMIPEFARLIRPGGNLLIGHAETLIGIEAGLRVLKPSFYERLNDGERS